MSTFVNLEYLTLENVHVADSTFKGLTHLKHLKLIECDFENFKSELYRSVPNLNGLFISNPRHLNINLNELYNLKWLKLSYVSNLCEHLSTLKHDNLEILDINFVYVDNFDAKCISDFSSLKSLRFSFHYNLKSINLNYDFLSCLESLYLECCYFPSKEISFSKLCNLKMLNLTISYLECMNSNILTGLSKLEKLEFSVSKNDSFIEIPSNFFDDLENLSSLTIHFKNLANINSQWFSKMPNLKSLNLNDNVINQVTKENFAYLKNLSSLSLSYNRLDHLDDGVFSYLKNLENLSITSNCRIKELRPQIFDGLDKLINIDMRDLNRRFQLDVDLFQVMPSLKRASLDERFKGMLPVLTQKYGYNITFYFN